MGQVVERGVHFGPYEGEMVGKDEALESGYSWVVRWIILQHATHYTQHENLSQGNA